MAMFNLEDYETVEERLKRAHAMYEDLRVATSLVNVDDCVVENKPNMWVVKAFIYLTAGDQANNLPKATGYAFEIDGTSGANKTSALENAETSAIGRALANMNLSGNKRASREEMQKLVSQPKNQSNKRDFLAEATQSTAIEQIREIYRQAQVANQPKAVLEQIKTIGEQLAAK
jgi:preprotein translocase subunit SecF